MEATVLHESLNFRALEMPCGCCERGAEWASAQRAAPMGAEVSL